MADICDIYSKGIKKKLKNYWAAWLPTTKYELGDIGVLNGYYFEKVGSLASLKIPFVTAADNSPSPIEFVSESGVSITIKLAGEMNEAFASVPQGRAGLKIDFGSQGAFIMQCPATYEPAISDPIALQREIIDALGRGAMAGRLGSHRSNRDRSLGDDPDLQLNPLGAGELSAEADLSAGLANLAKPSSGSRSESQTGDIIKMIRARGHSLLSARHTQETIVRAPKFTIRSMRGLDHSIKGATTSPTQDQLNALYLDVLRDEEVEGA